MWDCDHAVLKYFNQTPATCETEASDKGKKKKKQLIWIFKMCIGSKLKISFKRHWNPENVSCETLCSTHRCKCLRFVVFIIQTLLVTHCTKPAENLGYPVWLSGTARQCLRSGSSCKNQEKMKTCIFMAIGWLNPTWCWPFSASFMCYPCSLCSGYWSLEMDSVETSK